MLNGRLNLLGRLQPSIRINSRCLSECHYDVLGVPRSASDAEIKSAFISLSKQCHPDKTNDKKSHERFLRIMEAYTILSKTESRGTYDLKFRPPPSQYQQHSGGFQWYSVNEEDNDNLKAFHRYRPLHGHDREFWTHPREKSNRRKRQPFDDHISSRDDVMLNRPFYWLLVGMLFSMAFQLFIYNKEQKRKIVITSDALKKKSASGDKKE